MMPGKKSKRLTADMGNSLFRDAVFAGTARQNSMTGILTLQGEFVMTPRILVVGITLWLASAWQSLAGGADKPAPVNAPAGPSVRDIVEAGITQLNYNRNFKLTLPRGKREVVHSYLSNAFVPKAYHKKRVRWRGTVVENPDKKSKGITVLLGNFQGGGQTFQALAGATLPRGSKPPAVGTEVWVQGAVAPGVGWVDVRRGDDGLMITLPYLLANGRLLGDSDAKPEPAAGEDEAKTEREAGSRLRIARLLADNGKVAKARDRCREIIKLYPKTKAAEEAQKLLRKLDRK
jgi:hypothetical protein